MKYIRTKDGQIFKWDINGYLQSKRLNVSYGFYTDYNDQHLERVKLALNKQGLEFISQADTIEELFDNFVAYSKTLKKHWATDNLPSFKKWLIDKEWINCDFYAAIWTDKGLIYVAKMKGILPNGEIDWELL